MERKHAAIGGGLAVAYLLLADDPPAALEDAQNEVQSIYERVQEVSENGELVFDPATGVFYDDPEQGSLNDEAGDDANLSFDSVNDLLSDVGEYIDPTRYAPDVEGDATAPDSGVLADAGESQTFGSAGEAENDDLTERTADSNLSDDEKAAFDRLANVDDAETLDSHQDDSVTSSGSNYSTTSSSSTSSSGSTLSDDSDDDDYDPYAHLYDGDADTGGLVS